MSDAGAGGPDQRRTAAHAAETSHRQKTGRDESSGRGRSSVCATPLAARGRALAHGGRYAAAPVPAVGKMPDAATVFVGCLLWSSPDDAAGVLRLMAGDDFDAPLSVLVATIRHLVEAGKPCDASLVGDELRRTGQLSGPVAQALSAASVAGAIPEAAPYYAAIVVSKALRRKAESYGYALSTAAANAAECELLPLVTSAAADIAGTSHRLALLRGEA